LQHGNGRASSGRETGIAPEASLIVVRLGRKGRESFARTTEIMRAFKYIIDKAKSLNMPVAINLSFGTNDGSHDGKSLFETYIDDMARRWKSSIVVAAGNEGAAGHHFSSQISQGETIKVDFATSGNLESLYIALWKDFSDLFTFELITPSGLSTGVIDLNGYSKSIDIEGITIQSYFGQPNHYNESQEIYFFLKGKDSTIPIGLWTIVVNSITVTDGRFDMWLPTIEEVSYGTAFSKPSTSSTVTLPSTAMNVISVGGYNSHLDSATLFSGRGYTRGNSLLKPDLVAPSVDILTTKMAGGYDSFTGTSIAAPFVTGAAALMMEWGIVKKNDNFLYGQRIKAFLRKGATRDYIIEYPNPIWGYGSLCLKDTMDYLVNYIGGNL